MAAHFNPAHFNPSHFKTGGGVLVGTGRAARKRDLQPRRVPVNFVMLLKDYVELKMEVE